MCGFGCTTFGVQVAGWTGWQGWGSPVVVVVVQFRWSQPKCHGEKAEKAENRKWLSPPILVYQVIARLKLRGRPRWSHVFPTAVHIDAASVRMKLWRINKVIRQPHTAPVVFRVSRDTTPLMSLSLCHDCRGMAGEWTRFISELFSGKSTPVNLPGSGDASKPSDPFQPFGSDASDPFQSKKGVAGVPGDPFSGKDPFAPSASSKASRDSSLGFADFSSVSWAQWYSSSVQYTPLLRSLSLHSESWLFLWEKKRTKSLEL